ncbi:hypothetical protein Sme01_02620 [Sphaerisporangium melleum]|uniref:Transcriptional regulator WhiB n=1 Tax=Sphaerisporangium melleum TaxID=321316 RepID=A0A917QPQ4_9ACTN|nr:WhiB family transcriptional regulator [Sphaerisporangium melleum]GGK61019.1 hypothetical protein GCM10007964_00160 [Sphaerisporangium melleum]GII67786.1 hypothetical protein Sme01_02620 [Sphaerisporangium melleum]
MLTDLLATLADLAAENAWIDQALCGQVDPDLWYPEDGNAAQAERAKQVCRHCPVRAECLAYALDACEEHGVWGGLGLKERRRLRRDAA